MYYLVKVAQYPNNIESTLPILSQWCPRKFIAGMDGPVYQSKLDMKHLSMLSKDGTLKYDFMMSLEKIAMAKIAISLWMNPDTQQRIVDKKGKTGLVWRDIEDYIFSQVSQLCLPNSIAQKLNYAIESLGGCIYDWIWYHEDILTPSDPAYSAVNLINNITWTTRGRIDYLRTAKNILGNQDIHLTNNHKYKLACNYCLRDEIALLAPSVLDKSYRSSMCIDLHPMEYFWTSHITGEGTMLRYPSYFGRNNRDYNKSINVHIFELLLNLKTYNEVPIRFMWKVALTEKEKSELIFLLVKKVRNKDWILSLLSSFDFNLQQKVFQKYSTYLLLCILEDCWWWWGEYFLPTVLHVLDILGPESYWFLLSHINYLQHLVKGEYMFNQYKLLFKRLWLEYPANFKDYILQCEDGKQLADFVSSLSREQDMDLIKLIMSDLNAKQCIKTVCYPIMKGIQNYIEKYTKELSVNLVVLYIMISILFFPIVLFLLLFYIFFY